MIKDDRFSADLKLVTSELRALSKSTTTGIRFLQSDKSHHKVPPFKFLINRFKAALACLAGNSVIFNIVMVSKDNNLIVDASHTNRGFIDLATIEANCFTVRGMGLVKGFARFHEEIKQ